MHKIYIAIGNELLIEFISLYTGNLAIISGFYSGPRRTVYFFSLVVAVLVSSPGTIEKVARMLPQKFRLFSCAASFGGYFTTVDAAYAYTTVEEVT